MLKIKKSSFLRTLTLPMTEVYDDGFLRVEHNNFHVECGGNSLKLGRGEFLIISLLSQKAERYVSAECIWNYLWDKTRPLNLESLKVFIYQIRRKLKPFDIEIKTMTRVGYKLIPHSENIRTCDKPVRVRLHHKKI